MSATSREPVESAAPPMPDWLVRSASEFARCYTRRVSPLGMMWAAYLAGWDAAQRPDQATGPDAAVPT